MKLRGPSVSGAVGALTRPVFCLVLLSLSACSFLQFSEEAGPAISSRPSLGSLRPPPPPEIEVTGPAVTRLPPLPLAVTAEVKRELDYFLTRESSFISASLERREQYYPMLVEIFRDEGIPLELLNVALIESGFRPDVRSRAGAVGLWQFMKSTGRYYGLKITRKVDQRTDPILSTIAAARHLRDLYIAHGDWYLALGAYNAGSGGIERAINRARSDDFWDLCRKKKLRQQTARYVPRIIAATIIINRIVAPDRTQMSLNLEGLRRQNEAGALFSNY